MEQFFKYTLTGLATVVALGQFTQVVTRYVLEIPVMGMQEMILYPTLWLYMLGAVNASRENSHIRANVLEIFLRTPRQHAVLAVVGESLSLIIGLWLTYWAWEMTSYALEIGKTSPTLYIPTIFSDVALFAGLVAMMAYTTAHLMRHIRSLLRGGEAIHG